jgi:hypothetical protein
MASSTLRLNGHTQTHHIRWDSSGRVISSSQTPLPNNTQQSREAEMHDPGGIQNHNPKKQAAVTHALDRAATGTGSHLTIYLNQKLQNREQIINH